MSHRSNHYDAAFEAVLRERRIPFVRVDEARRAQLADASLKSMDFVVHPPGGPNLIVDVKGRRHPSGGATTSNRFETWVTRDDVVSLPRWETIFGEGYLAVFVFAFELFSPDGKLSESRPFRRVHRLGGRRYGFAIALVAAYRERMTRRSASWDTVHLPTAAVTEVLQPLDNWISEPASPMMDSPGEPTRSRTLPPPMHRELPTSDA